MKKNLIILTVLLLPFLGCEKEKEPVACFSLSSTYVDIYEVINSTNCSSNGYSFLWNDGEGNQTTDEETPFFYSEPGTYIITLIAFSESGDKQNTATESVIVREPTGSASFWQSGTPAYGITTVTIGTLTARITIDYPSGISDCNQSGCANFTLPVGSYSFHASDGVTNWNSTINIVMNECLKFQLQ